MSKPLVAVSGSNGQLGKELQVLHERFSDAFDFVFLTRDTFDLQNPASVALFFSTNQPSYFINCAAYTAVDKAETEQAAAYRINAEAVGEIALHCRACGAVLLQISTDYVFNGKGTAPYKVIDATEPVNYYGYTKWMGEQLALQNNPHSVVIRTSWVYSYFGHNFVKTMLRLVRERSSVSVVSDQVGCPTYAADLAEALMHILAALRNGAGSFGLYHYSNSGPLSWFGFATAIRDMAGVDTQVLPIATADYPTPAKRPAYSVMDTSRITADYDVTIKPWRQSLQSCLLKLMPDYR